MLFNSTAKRILCAFLATAMIAVALGFLIAEDRREAQERKALVTRYENEKRVYDQKINELKKQLRQKREELFEGLPSLSSALCVGIRASSEAELLEVLRVVEPFGYPITVILDAELPAEEINGILAAIRQRENCCVIPCGGEAAMRRLMEAEGDRIYPLAYLDGRASEEMKASLAAGGFVGYSEALGSDARVVSTVISADSVSALAHIPLGEDNALNAAAADAAGRGLGIFLTVDMAGFGRSFTMETVTRILERLGESYVDAGDMKASTVSDYLDGARECVAEREKAEAAIAAYEEQKNAEIAKLEEEIQRLAERYRWW